MTAVLWIEDSGLSDTEIRQACAPAQAAIHAAGVSVEEAYQASRLECDGQSFDSVALAAWREADRIALAGVDSDRAILSIA